MNWGYKILFVYFIFVSGIVYLVVRSSSQNQDLVTTDYYEQELKYQDKIDAIQNTNALSSPVKYEVRAGEIQISLPGEMKGNKITAEVLLYCTTDKNKDIRQNITTEDGIILFPLPNGNKGWHELKLSWNKNKTNYYYEHKLMIP